MDGVDKIDLKVSAHDVENLHQHRIANGIEDLVSVLAVRHDLLVYSDEIYDRLVYNGYQMRCMSALPGMRRILREAHPLLFLELHGPESEKVAWEILTAAGYTLRQMAQGYPEIKSADELGWKAYVIAN